MCQYVCVSRGECFAKLDGRLLGKSCSHFKIKFKVNGRRLIVSSVSVETLWRQASSVSSLDFDAPVEIM